MTVPVVADRVVQAALKLVLEPIFEADFKRERRRLKDLPNWRVVLYADDFVVLVHGTAQDTEALREEIAHMLLPIGLRLSPAKTQVVHMSERFDFLGFHI
jgi:RNA-directed DNA polymerase